MAQNKQLDPLQLSGDLTHEALVTCIESTEAAVELGSKISLHADHLMKELQEILDEARTASIDSAMLPAAPILNLVEKFNLIVLESASLGALCGTFHDVTDKLTAALSCMKKCGLYTGSIPINLLLDDSVEIDLIATRAESSQEWRELTLTEFLDLPLLKRAEMLVRNHNKFFTAENEEIPSKQALKTLRNVISSKKATSEDLFSVSRSSELSILIVDDDAVVQAAMRRKIIEEFGSSLQIVLANDGIEGLAILEGTHESKSVGNPLLVFLDIHMPGMDGLEVLSQLRQIEHMRDSVVFILTATTEEKLEMKAYALGCAGLLKKRHIGEDMNNIVGLIDLYRQTAE